MTDIQKRNYNRRVNMELQRFSEACSTAQQLIGELLCYSTGVSALNEERPAELLEKFISLYPEGKDEL